MRSIIIFLLMLTCTPAPAQQSETWYKVTASSDVWWGVGNHIYIIESRGTDSIQFKGFTNLGVSVWGSAREGRLLIPNQTVRVKSFNHNGPVEYDIVAEGNGILTDSLITLQFYLKPDTNRAATGEIKAIRWSWPQQWESSKSHAPDPRRDTVIKGVKYTYVLYDLNRRPGLIGERYEHNKKNGRWLYSDIQGLLEKEVQYVNDTLNGCAVEYHNWATPLSRSQGMYLQGRQVGKWILEQRKNKHKWKTAAYLFYDAEGSLISKALTYTNGRPYLEMYYAKSGEMIWYSNYDEDGKLIEEGDHFKEGVLLEGKVK